MTIEELLQGELNTCWIKKWTILWLPKLIVAAYIWLPKLIVAANILLPKLIVAAFIWLPK